MAQALSRLPAAGACGLCGEGPARSTCRRRLPPPPRPLLPAQALVTRSFQCFAPQPAFEPLIVAQSRHPSRRRRSHCSRRRRRHKAAAAACWRQHVQRCGPGSPAPACGRCMAARRLQQSSRRHRRVDVPLGERRNRQQRRRCDAVRCGGGSLEVFCLVLAARPVVATEEEWGGQHRQCSLDCGRAWWLPKMSSAPSPARSSTLLPTCSAFLACSTLLP